MWGITIRNGYIRGSLGGVTNIAKGKWEWIDNGGLREVGNDEIISKW